MRAFQAVAGVFIAAALLGGCATTPVAPELSHNEPKPEVKAPEFLWYKLDSTSGDQLLDASSHATNAKLDGEYRWQAGALVMPLPGSSGGETAPLPNEYRETPATISAWVTPFARADKSLNAHAEMPFPANTISNDIPGRGGFGFGVNVWTDDGGGSGIFLAGASYKLVPGVTFSAGRRSFIAVVYSATDTKLYVDGALKLTAEAATLPPGSAPLYIGRHNNDAAYGSKRFFVGEIDDVRWYKRALNDAEVTALNQAGPS